MWFWYAVPFKRKLSLRSEGGIIRLFANKGSCWLGLEDVVKASVGSTEENSGWNKRYSSKKRKRWSTRSSLKEIVNFVFNKSKQETRRTPLFRLILHKKETPRRRFNPKNWLQNELCHKILKKGILSLTKVKLTVGRWRHGFEQVSRYISLYPSSSFFFCYNIIVTWMYVIFVTLFNVFDKHRGKYAKLDIVKFISLEINYFVGTGCFVFKKCWHTFLSCNKSKFPFPLFLPPLFFIHFSIPSLSLTVTVRFLGVGYIFWIECEFLYLAYFVSNRNLYIIIYWAVQEIYKNPPIYSQIESFQTHLLWILYINKNAQNRKQHKVLRRWFYL